MTGSHQPGRLMRDVSGTFGPYTHDHKSCTGLAASCMLREFGLFPVLWDTLRRIALGLICITCCTATVGWDAFGIGVLVTSLLLIPYQHRGL